MTAQQSQPAIDPMFLAAEGAIEAVATRLRQWATGHYDDITMGAKRAALVAIDSAAPIIRDAARAQAFREAADMVANCKPETDNPDFRRALEAFQTAIAAGLRITANLTGSSVARCTCDTISEPGFPHRPWCATQHQHPGPDCAGLCEPGDAQP